MNRQWNKMYRWLVLCIVLLLGMSINVSAEGFEDDADKQLEYTEGENLAEIWGKADQYADGIYNVGENARVDLTGMVRLSQYKTKLQADYTTGYTYRASKLGIKNLKLQYKGSLGIWNTIITIDDRYWTDTMTYMGSFTCNGTIGRTYRLQGTHYAVVDGTTISRFNTTENLTFR